MDFAWSEDQLSIYRETAGFAKDKLSAILDGDAFDATRFRKAMKLCGAHGLLGGVVSAEYDGSDLDALSVCYAMEGLGYGCRDMGFVFSAGAQLFATILPVAQFGGDALRDRYLKALVGGELVAAHAASEPEFGSDAFSMGTRAEKEGDDYVLNGSKTYVTNAPCADVYITFARINPKAGIFGLTAFLVDRDNPGIAVSPPHEKTGLRGSPIGDVHFDDCRIPAENRIGPEGQGARIFIHSMNWERVGIMCSYIGMMERQLEETIAYARDRRQFGKQIKDFQAVSHKIAEMKLRLE